MRGLHHSGTDDQRTGDRSWARGRWSLHRTVRGRIGGIEAPTSRDTRWASRLAAVQREGRCRIHRAVDRTDPFLDPEGSDHRQMLSGIGNDRSRVVIEGPGAGIDVTANSAPSDLTEVIARMTARSRAALQ